MINLTPIQIDTFTKVFSYTKPCASIFIAGGAVANLMKATDIDVWFCNAKTEDVQAYLKSLPYYEMASNDTNYIGGDILIGEAYIPGITKPIQVISTHYESAEQTLDNFDLSIHAHAVLSRQLQVISHPKATSIPEPIKLIHEQGHKKTLGRYIKLCARYGFTPDVELIKQITPKMPENDSLKNFWAAQKLAILPEVLTYEAIKKIHDESPNYYASKIKF